MAVAKLRHQRGASNEVLGGLRQLGFSDYEARIYVQLLKTSPATAYEVSKTAGVPRANAYAALEALAQRGAVLLVNEEPLRYVAAPPKSLLEGISRQTRVLCNDLSSELSSLTAASQDTYVWTAHGDIAVMEKIESMIVDSRRSIWIKAADDIIRRHKSSLQKAAARGVSLIVVLFGSDPQEFQFNRNCRIYVHESDGTRMGTADNLFTIAVDHQRMLTANTEGEVIGAYTGCAPIVTMALSLIRHDLYIAEIFKRFGAQIDREFGPYLRDVRMSCFTADQIASFKERTGLK
jgi:sugar-specific transcriptional regulator TrmB